MRRRQVSAVDVGTVLEDGVLVVVNRAIEADLLPNPILVLAVVEVIPGYAGPLSEAYPRSWPTAIGSPLPTTTGSMCA